MRTVEVSRSGSAASSPWAFSICSTVEADRIESSSATRYGTYSFAGIDSATDKLYATAHGGYDPTYANHDPNRVLPLDVMRDLEREGAFGKLYETWYSTVGNGTPVAMARKFGEEMGQALKAAGVDAVILTST